MAGDLEGPTLDRPRPRADRDAARPVRLDPDGRVVVADMADQRTQPERARRGRGFGRVDGRLGGHIRSSIGPQSPVEKGFGVVATLLQAGSSRLVGAGASRRHPVVMRPIRPDPSASESTHLRTVDHAGCSARQRVAALRSQRRTSMSTEPRGLTEQPTTIGAGGQDRQRADGSVANHGDVRTLVAWYVIAIASLVGFVALTLFIAGHGVFPFDGP